MLSTEEITDLVLINEGQILLGLEYLTEAFGLDLNKIERIFSSTIKQYSRRRPIEITRDFNNNGNPIQLPAGTLGIKSIRWGLLPTYPRFFQDAWEKITYEYDMASKKLKVFPPGISIKVTYVSEPTLTKSTKVYETFDILDGESFYEDYMKNTYRQGTLKITKNCKEMVEIARNPNSNPGKIILQGELGTGEIDIKTKQFQLNLDNTSRGTLEFSYYPKYFCCEELDIGDYIFYKFFALNLLRSIASLKAQNTQTELHNVDLTVDMLLERVMKLEIEVNKLLKSTISVSGFSQI